MVKVNFLPFAKAKDHEFTLKQKQGIIEALEREVESWRVAKVAKVLLIHSFNGLR